MLQHFWYQGQPAREGWQLIDRNLGLLHRIAADKGYNMLAMSDHGCGPVDTVFYINTWLAQEGYLIVNLPAGSERLGRWGLNRGRLIALVRRWGLAPLLRKLIPTRLQRALPSAGGTFDKEAKAKRIHWENSLAIASGQGPIYLLIAPDHPEYESLRDEIMVKLGDLRNPATGQPVAARVLRREEVYEGTFFHRAPDLIFEQGPGIHTGGGVGHDGVFETPEKWAADNVLEGLFLAWGPDFEPQGYIEGTRIIDLAPTILHALETPIPDDVDGRVLSELLAPESEAACRRVIFRPAPAYSLPDYTAEDEAEIAARLSALGYLE